jgi:carbon storage regulator CsrA
VGLVLTRRKHESIVIGSITITVREISSLNQVKLEIVAPRDVVIWRQEIIERAARENQRAAALRQARP